jgi:hypothetical protein
MYFLLWPQVSAKVAQHQRHPNRRLSETAEIFYIFRESLTAKAQMW